jgi:GntR family transcriptional regulator, carbon starvation induced regulator
MNKSAPIVASHRTNAVASLRGLDPSSITGMIAADALPWAANSLNWKSQELDRSSTPSVSSYVLARIRGDILSAYFKPGAKLHLKVLTARYDTSVAPVREALAVLSGAGLVVAESQRGFRVAPASRADFVDVLMMRQYMEALAFEKSIELGDDKWVDEICRVYSAFSRLSTKAGCGDPISDAWEVHHREFHFVLISRCGSPTLLNFCSQLHDRFDRYRRLILPNSSYMAGTASDHEEIRDAVIRRDKALAVALIKEHITAIGDVILEQYDAHE